MAYQSFTDVLDELENRAHTELNSYTNCEALQRAEGAERRGSLKLYAQVRLELAGSYVEPKTIYRAVAKAQVQALHHLGATESVAYVRGVTEASVKLLIKADAMARQRK